MENGFISTRLRTEFIQFITRNTPTAAQKLELRKAIQRGEHSRFEEKNRDRFVAFIITHLHKEEIDSINNEGNDSNQIVSGAVQRTSIVTRPQASITQTTHTLSFILNTIGRDFKDLNVLEYRPTRRENLNLNLRIKYTMRFIQFQRLRGISTHSNAADVRRKTNTNSYRTDFRNYVRHGTTTIDDLLSAQDLFDAFDLLDTVYAGNPTFRECITLGLNNRGYQPHQEQGDEATNGDSDDQLNHNEEDDQTRNQQDTNNRNDQQNQDDEQGQQHPTPSENSQSNTTTPQQRPTTNSTSDGDDRTTINPNDLDLDGHFRRLKSTVTLTQADSYPPLYGTRILFYETKIHQYLENLGPSIGLQRQTRINRTKECFLRMEKIRELMLPRFGTSYVIACRYPTSYPTNDTKIYSNLNSDLDKAIWFDTEPNACN